MATLQLGENVHYELDNINGAQDQSYMLGRGAFGTVRRYRLVEASANNGNENPEEDAMPKRIAVKIMVEARSNEFDTEVKILQNVRHDNIVKYIGFTSIDPNLFLCMELCDGNLSELLKQTEIIYKTNVVEQFKQIATGLKYLHDNRIAHRDLKTENILFKKQDKNLIFKIADFGHSKIIKEDKFMECTTLGTKKYMSPEVARAHYESKINFPGESPESRIQTDMFSLGVIYFEIIVGIVPFEFKELINLKIESSRRKDSDSGTGDEFMIDVYATKLSSVQDYELKMLINKLLKWKPQERISANEVLCHNALTKIGDDYEYPLALHCLEYTSSHFNVEHQTLIIGYRDGSVKFFTPGADKLKEAAFSHNDEVKQICSAGEYFATRSMECVNLCNFDTLKAVRRFTPAKWSITACDISENVLVLYTHYTLEVWSVEETPQHIGKKEIKGLDGRVSVIIVDSNSFLVSGTFHYALIQFESEEMRIIKLTETIQQGARRHYPEATAIAKIGKQSGAFFALSTWAKSIVVCTNISSARKLFYQFSLDSTLYSFLDMLTESRCTAHLLTFFNRWPLAGVAMPPDNSRGGFYFILEVAICGECRDSAAEGTRRENDHCGEPVRLTMEYVPLRFSQSITYHKIIDSYKYDHIFERFRNCLTFENEKAQTPYASFWKEFQEVDESSRIRQELHAFNVVVASGERVDEL